MGKIAILIPVYNALEYTNQALINLKSGIANSNWEINKTIFIVVIDDGSTDNTSQLIKQMHPEVELCFGDGNLWWSGAINKGAEHAFKKLDCDYVLLWNNDVISDQNYFHNLFEIIHSDKVAAVFGSKIIINNTNLIWFMGGIFNPNTGKKTMIGLSKPDGDYYQHITECDWITGMGTVIHKSVVDKIGYWDAENFPQYHGDVDFTYRAKKAGFKLFVYPALLIKNDITHTGILHNLTFESLKKSLTSIKSDFNVKKDLVFYRKHSTNKLAYIALFIKYFKYVGGFIKQKYFHFNNRLN